MLVLPDCRRSLSRGPVIGDTSGVNARKPRKPRSTNETSQLLPEKVRQPLQVSSWTPMPTVPLGPDIASLAALATDLAAIGICTWIPQPVAWEWAEHLARQWTAARNAIKTPANHLRRAGLLPLLRLEPRYDDRAAFIAAFLDRLDRVPHVEVVPLTKVTSTVTHSNVRRTRLGPGNLIHLKANLSTKRLGCSVCERLLPVRPRYEQDLPSGLVLSFAELADDGGCVATRDVFSEQQDLAALRGFLETGKPTSKGFIA